jgi:GTP-dependent phosphoenolpyruvate carboxykinase
MARSISAVERTFVTCSAPNITGGFFHVIVYIESRSGFNALKSLTKNNIIFSEFFYKNNTILCKKWMNRQGHTLFMSKLSVRQNV